LGPFSVLKAARLSEIRVVTASISRLLRPESSMAEPTVPTFSAMWAVTVLVSAKSSYTRA